MRKERGITLVALVITIVVLLILAGVAITALTGDNNIIGKAKEAKEKQEEASTNEDNAIKEYGEFIDKALNNNHESLVQFPITVKVGDNAYATWTNDQGGGKITVSGTGETYEDAHIEELLFDELKKQGLNNATAFIVYFKLMETADYDYVEMFKDEDLLEELGIVEEDIPTLLELAEEINSIEYIVYEEGITKIGSNQIGMSMYATSLLLPNSLTALSANAFDESIFYNPIIIPADVKKIERMWFSDGENAIYMRANKADVTYGDNINEGTFESEYDVTWGYEG